MQLGDSNYRHNTDSINHFRDNNFLIIFFNYAKMWTLLDRVIACIA